MKKPGYAIPFGTLGASVFTFIVYLLLGESHLKFLNRVVVLVVFPWKLLLMMSCNMLNKGLLWVKYLTFSNVINNEMQLLKIKFSSRALTIIIIKHQILRKMHLAFLNQMVISWIKWLLPNINNERHFPPPVIEYVTAANDFYCSGFYKCYVSQIFTTKQLQLS